MTCVSVPLVIPTLEPFCGPFNISIPPAPIIFIPPPSASLLPSSHSRPPHLLRLPASLPLIGPLAVPLPPSLPRLRPGLLRPHHCGGSSSSSSVRGTVMPWPRCTCGASVAPSSGGSGGEWLRRQHQRPQPWLRWLRWLRWLPLLLWLLLLVWHVRALWAAGIRDGRGPRQGPTQRAHTQGRRRCQQGLLLRWYLRWHPWRPHWH